jgi:hypothetical protein
MLSFFKSARENILFSAKRVRRTYRRAQQEIRFGKPTLESTPIIFANSFPKSGTHLLTQIIQGFSRIGPMVDSGLPAVLTFEGESGKPRHESDILADLKRLQPGDTVYGHLHAMPSVVAYLCRPSMATYFLLRDPRDVVVSHVHYVTEIDPKHAHHKYYTEELQDFNERLNISILGRPGWENPFPDIFQRFEPYLGWLNKPTVMVLHFEELINEMTSTIRRVLDHAIEHGFVITDTCEAAIESLTRGVDPKRSPTFRAGKVGSWRNSFTDDHKRLFKEVAGDLLVKLGYEGDNDW